MLAAAGVRVGRERRRGRRPDAVGQHLQQAEVAARGVVVVAARRRARRRRRTGDPEEGVVGGRGSGGQRCGDARPATARQRLDQRLRVSPPDRRTGRRPRRTSGDEHDTENSWLFGWSTVASVAASEGSAAVEEVQVPLVSVSITACLKPPESMYCPTATQKDRGRARHGPARLGEATALRAEPEALVRAGTRVRRLWRLGVRPGGPVLGLDEAPGVAGRVRIPADRDAHVGGRTGGRRDVGLRVRTPIAGVSGQRPLRGGPSLRRWCRTRGRGRQRHERHDEHRRACACEQRP